MDKNKFVLLTFATGMLLLSNCKKEENINNVDCSMVNSSYSANIKPIINANCISSGCHNANSTNGDFTTYNGLKAKADNGSLNNRVVQQKNMPPSQPLSLDDLEKIKCWINSGAPNN